MKLRADRNVLQKGIIDYFERKNLEFNGETFSIAGKSIKDGPNCGGISDLIFELNDETLINQVNIMIEGFEFKPCNITPMRVSRLLFKHGDKLTVKAKDNIKAYLNSIKEEYCSAEMDFVGVNDNFPIGGLYAVLAMAKFLEDESLLKVAEKRFKQLEKLLKRQGCLSEYNSGYTPFQLYLISNVAEIAPTEHMRKIALDAQNRIWFDFISHYNIELGTNCGPFAREYLAVGERETNNCFFYNLFNPEIQLKLSREALSFEILLFLCQDYDCDETIVNLFYKKQFPFEFRGTAECSASTDSTPESLTRSLEDDDVVYEYSAGMSNLYTYMSKYYGMGTATKEWHSGVQTSSFSLSYKRVEVPVNEWDTREVFCRYLLNDETVDGQRFFEQGRKCAFGHRNHAVVLYKPKIAAIPAVHNLEEGRLAQHYRRQEISGNLGVTSAKLVIEIPLCGVMPDKVMVGNAVIDIDDNCFDEVQSVCVQDGCTYFAVHPLEISDKGREKAMSVRLRDGMLEIAFYNYQGAIRDFAARDFLHIRNGFAFTVSSMEEYPDFESFLENEGKVVIEDELISTVHSRQTYVRHVKASFKDAELECEISPASEGIKYMTVNDFPMETSKLYATGFDTNQLPLMK